ncbi:MarR family transcriptional regulator [Naumannella sp. ID2617S]|nr:MarR family transcriptional regulator [Naumannella sp. ID2617S]
MATSYALVLARLSAMAEREVEVLLGPEGLRIEDWRVLDHLAGSESATMSALADAVLLTGPTLTRTVDKLVSLGFVHRSASPDDRRKVLVHLTRRGSALQQRLQPRVAESEMKALQTDSADVALRRLASQLLAR